jgi:nucleoid DNA-binding protein
MGKLFEKVILRIIQRTLAKLTVYKALIRYIMTYVFPSWEFAADSHLLKLQRLQNKVLRTTGNLPRRTSTRDLYVTFKISYVYNFVAKLCRQQAEVIQNHENVNICNIGSGEAQHRKYKKARPLWKKKRVQMSEKQHNVQIIYCIRERKALSPIT